MSRSISDNSKIEREGRNLEAIGNDNSTTVFEAIENQPLTYIIIFLNTPRSNR